VHSSVPSWERGGEGVSETEGKRLPLGDQRLQGSDLAYFPPSHLPLGCWGPPGLSGLEGRGASPERPRNLCPSRFMLFRRVPSTVPCKKIKNSQALVAHFCNPSYSGGSDQEDQV
jgi:hypothetical protein